MYKFIGLSKQEIKKLETEYNHYAKEYTESIGRAPFKFDPVAGRYLHFDYGDPAPVQSDEIQSSSLVCKMTLSK